MSLTIDTRAWSTRVGRRTALLVATLAVTVMAIPAVSEANTGKRSSVTVMTRNVFLGADLGPRSPRRDSPPRSTPPGGSGTSSRRRTSPSAPSRSRGRSRSPMADLVGLQEVALWRQQIPSDIAAPPKARFGRPATEVKYDFLALLLQELRRSAPTTGGRRPAGVRRRAARGPRRIRRDGHFSPSARSSTGGLTMRDVILRRTTAK